METNTQLSLIGVNDVRDINQTLLLRLIREKQPVSRAEIAKFTGLRTGTVSSIVNRLIKNNYVYEGSEGPSSGGRPPKNLYVNAESVYVLAVDIGVQDTFIAVSDFNGRILKQESILTEEDSEKFIEKLYVSVKKLISENYAKTKFGAIGISVPGLIDRTTGTVETSPNLGWKNVELKKKLEKRLKIPVVIENDANAAAFSELWYAPSSAAKINTLLYILVVEGLGTGLIIDGKLHVGSPKGMGGFGHMSIDPNGELCSCGRRGCWEIFASERATVERFHKATAKQNTHVIGFRELISLAYKNDEMALESLKITAEYLGEGICNLAHGLYPETIVIGGNITAAWSLIEPIIIQKVHSRYILDPKQIHIRQAGVPRPSLSGAIPIALQNCPV